MFDDLGFALAIVFSEIMPAAVFLYAAYWAFAIRRALVSRIYRRHALWLGALGVVVAVAVFLTYSTNYTVNIMISIYYDILFAVVFAFVDSLIPVARRSDPLLRSVLSWEKLRYFLWADVAVLGAFNTLSYVSYLTPAFSSGLAKFIVQDAGWFAAAAVLFGLSGLAILIAVRRSGDIVLRSSLKWLGVMLIFVVFLFAAYTAEYYLLPNLTQFDFFYSYPVLPWGIVFIVVAYALYRSARSLAPVNRLTVNEQA